MSDGNFSTTTLFSSVISIQCLWLHLFVDCHTQKTLIACLLADCYSQHMQREDAVVRSEPGCNYKWFYTTEKRFWRLFGTYLGKAIRTSKYVFFSRIWINFFNKLEGSGVVNPIAESLECQLRACTHDISVKWFWLISQTFSIMVLMW